MGFLKHLLFWPVTGPLYLADFSLRHVQEVVRQELTDDDRIKEELLDLQLRLELGEVDEEEYLREEARLMEALREVRQWREELGMATRGGVVQVGDATSGGGTAPDARPDAAPDPSGPGDDAGEEEERWTSTDDSGPGTSSS